MMVDDTKWRHKYARFQKEIIQCHVDMIKAATQILSEEIIKNLTGPFYGFKEGPRGGRKPVRGPETNAGTLPVPRVTGQLHDSIDPPKKINLLLYVIKQNRKKANYGLAVHDGTDRDGNGTDMEQRPYWEEAVKKRGPLIKAMWIAKVTKLQIEIGRS